MKKLLWYLVKAPMRFYITTWVFFLIWRKRTVPKWLRLKVTEEMKDEPEIGQQEAYHR